MSKAMAKYSLGFTQLRLPQLWLPATNLIWLAGYCFVISFSVGVYRIIIHVNRTECLVEDSEQNREAVKRAVLAVAKGFWLYERFRVPPILLESHRPFSPCPPGIPMSPITLVAMVRKGGWGVHPADIANLEALGFATETSEG